MTEKEAEQRANAREAHRILRAQDLGPQGRMRERYESYVYNAVAQRWEVKTFDQWLNS